MAKEKQEETDRVRSGTQEGEKRPETPPKEFLYQLAIERWGVDLQGLVAIEEMAELTQAISKATRKGSLKDREVDKAVDNLCEEIADVEIMLEQLAWWIPKGRDRIAQYKQSKLKRLNKLLEETQ